jgi:hypothetical protein
MVACPNAALPFELQGDFCPICRGRNRAHGVITREFADAIRDARRLAETVSLRRVRLDSGGYDENGRYFGIGEPLYIYTSLDMEIRSWVRARSRAEARAHVLAKHPHAKVRR